MVGCLQLLWRKSLFIIRSAGGTTLPQPSQFDKATDSTRGVI